LPGLYFYRAAALLLKKCINFPDMPEVGFMADSNAGGLAVKMHHLVSGHTTYKMLFTHIFCSMALRKKL
jgi:hypothetical protein